LRGGGDDEEPPPAPTYQQPSWSANLPPEVLGYIRQGVGKQITEPTEYGLVSQYLQNLMGYKPEQFAYPLTDIQRALEAQQALQLEQYQKQIRPVLAQQGQLDSTYYANLLGDYIKNQQSQALTNYANLLTNQATQNYNLAQWLPQFQSSVAGQLAGLGGQRVGIQQYNLQYPYQTYIPALQGIYGAGQQEAMNMLQPQLAQYNNQYQQYLQNQQQQNALMSSIYGGLGQLGMSALTGGLGGLAMGTGFGSGVLSGLFGISPSTIYQTNALSKILNPTTFPSTGVSSKLLWPSSGSYYTDLLGGRTLGQLGGIYG